MIRRSTYMGREQAWALGAGSRGAAGSEAGPAARPGDGLFHVWYWGVAVWLSQLGLYTILL